ncbi:MAG TPA: hypothetical protein ENK28_02295 [Aliiroseovarius sp.]|nr:hypothetical protein [Aliiroseovarius sp.]
MTEDEYTPPPSPLSEAEQQVALESSPRGTWAILFIYGIIFILTWLYFWYGLFVPAGAVS